MENTVFIDKPDETLQRIARSIGYSGRKFKIQSTDWPIDVRSYWDGGSRDYFYFVSLADGRLTQVPAQSAFDKPIAGAESVTLPDGIACVRHSIFCGKDLGLTIHVNPANMAAFLPAQQDTLSRNEEIVLAATRSLKSAFRFDEARRVTGISRKDYDVAKVALIDAGYLNKAGAITTKGRNTSASDLWKLRMAA